MTEIEYVKFGMKGQQLRRQLLEVPRGWTLSPVEKIGQGPTSLRGYKGGRHYPCPVYRTREAAERRLERNGWRLPGTPEAEQEIDVRTAREALDLTQAEAGRILWIRPSTIYRWETSETLRIDPLHRVLVGALCRIAAHHNVLQWAHDLKAALRDGRAEVALFTLLDIERRIRQ